MPVDPADELRALSDAATKGPWEFEVSHSDPEGDYPVGIHGPERGQWVVRFDDDTGTNQWADAAFIVAAVNYVRSALAAPALPEPDR